MYLPIFKNNIQTNEHGRLKNAIKVTVAKFVSKSLKTNHLNAVKTNEMALFPQMVVDKFEMT